MVYKWSESSPDDGWCFLSKYFGMKIVNHTCVNYIYLLISLSVGLSVYLYIVFCLSICLKGPGIWRIFCLNNIAGQTIYSWEWPTKKERKNNGIPQRFYFTESVICKKKMDLFFNQIKETWKVRNILKNKYLITFLLLNLILKQTNWIKELFWCSTNIVSQLEIIYSKLIVMLISRLLKFDFSIFTYCRFFRITL